MIQRSGRLRACRNVQDELHADDPALYPRDATTAYQFSAEDQIFLYQSFDGPDPVIAVYHSHPRGGTGFSHADRAGATFDGRPIYPPLIFLVLDAARGGADEAAAYRFHDDGRVVRIASWRGGNVRAGWGPRRTR
jgi:proteasome lid subunit RPN8/RPN11